ncbi:hypothetical protein AYO41_05225 [Verrucomicrobia bacterium SCGC AG-212-E04]|nr:hypothetical protein AYO41_05225 [Verrucomicrobia bacterium SCGC AG-212-E04]
MPAKRVIIRKNPSGSGTFRDLDLETRARELASFRDEVYENGPLTQKAVQKWIGGAIARQRLLAGVVFGHIRWPKSLGRPLTPSLGDAFEFVHKRKNLNGADSASGTVNTSVLQTMPAPFVHDASTVDEYRVAFQFFGELFNHFNYRMREGPWERPAGLRPGYRFLDPYEIVPFTSDGTQTIFLEDIQVRYVPLIRVGGIRVLK